MTAFEVYNKTTSSERLIGRVFLDLYTREGKYDGFGSTTVRKSIAGKQLGEVIISASLLDAAETPVTIDDVREVSKAFGGCMHILLSQQPLSRMAGLDAIEADFAGVSSQVMHNWFDNSDMINSIVSADHESSPQESLVNIVATANIGKAMVRLDSLVAGEISVCSLRFR